MPDLVPQVTRFLSRLRSRQKAIWAGSIAIALFALLLLLALGVVLVEGWFWLNPAGRSTLLLVAAAVGGLTMLLTGGMLLFLLIRRNWPSDDSLARRVWKQDSAVRDRILNALQLGSGTGGSESLRRAALQQYDRFASSLHSSEYVKRQLFHRVLRSAVGVLLISGIAWMAAPSSFTGSVYRLQHPKQRFLRPGTVLLALELEDTVSVVQGEALRVSVRASNALPEQVQFVLDEGNGIARTVVAERDTTGNSRYTARITGLQRSLTVYAKAQQAFSDSSWLEVVPRPRIARLQVEVRPPEYTGQSRHQLPEGVGDILALPGSIVSVDVEASRSLQEAHLVFSPEGGTAHNRMMDARGRQASHTFTLQQAGSWWLKLVAMDGVESGDPLVWTISLSEDLPPNVEIRMPEDGTRIPEDLVVPLVVVADDDYGISRLALRFLVYNELTTPDSLPDEAYAAIELNGDTLGPGRVAVQTLWSLQGLELFPEDEVHYFVEAWDNDIPNGPKRARTPVRRLLYATLEEIFAEMDRQEAMNGQQLQQSLRQAEDVRRQLEETLTRMRSNPEDLSWEESRALEEAMQDQQELFDQLEQAARTLEQMQQQFQQQNMVSMELLEKYSRVQQLLEQVATPEMREAMENLREAMEQQDGDRIREALEQMNFSQEEFIENLDRTLSILEQLNQERRMEELVQRAEDLAQRQQDLSERMENATQQEWQRIAAEQENISNGVQQLNEDMNRLAEEMADRQPETAESLRDLAQELSDQDLPAQMQRTSEQIQQGQCRQAQENSRRHQQQLNELSQSLQDMQQQMLDQSMQNLADLMNELKEKILIVSARQEIIREESRRLGVSSPRYRSLAAHQDALRDAMRVLMNEAGELTRQTFFVGAQLMAELVNARQRMDGAIELYTDRRPREVSGEQTEALASLHRSLVQLQNAQNQMSQSASSTGYQEMMDKLSQMAQQQQMLNQMSQGMPMPSPMPMPGRQPGGDMLSQMAAQQRALAEAMRQLEQQGQGMQDILGRLDGLADAMEEVADEMEDRNMTERTRQLQQRILQRLLDSQRSLQQRERSRERMSRTADDIQRLSPDLLPRDREAMLRERMLRALEGDFSEPWQQVIRNYYRALQRDLNLQPSTDTSSQ